MPFTKTFRHIAERAGVSRMSVSRALGNQPGVSAKTRARILKIAEEIGYRPNPLISTLMSSFRAHRVRPSTETGTVLAFVARAARKEDAHMEHFSGAARAAGEQGFRIEPFLEGDGGLQPGRLNDVLIARNIRGVLIAPLPEDHGHFDFDWSRFCVAAIEYTFVSPGFDRVVHDCYSSMRMVLKECRSRNFQRIGLLFSKNGRERTEGLIDAAYWMEQKRTGDFRAIPPLCLGFWDDRNVAGWMDQHNVEVVVCSNAFLEPLQALLKCRGIRVPGDISLVNINGPKSHVSGINQNNALIGATAARLVIDKIHRNDSGIPEHPITHLTPGLWIEGATLRPKKA